MLTAFNMASNRSFFIHYLYVNNRLHKNKKKTCNATYLSTVKERAEINKMHKFNH